MASDQERKLHTGTAWIRPASDKGIVKPLIPAGKAGPGESDLAALRARLHPAAYSSGEAVRARGRRPGGPADPPGAGLLAAGPPDVVTAGRPPG